MRWALAVITFAGCAPFVDEPKPIAPTTVVPAVQNNLTVNNINVTVVPPPEPEPEPERGPERGPDLRPQPQPEPQPEPHRVITGGVTYVQPGLCRCMASAPPVIQAGQLASTGVAACDTYLTQAEQMMRCSTQQPGALSRATDSLDLARRTWRGVAATPAGRAQLEDSCGVAARGLASSLHDACNL